MTPPHQSKPARKMLCAAALLNGEYPPVPEGGGAGAIEPNWTISAIVQFFYIGCNTSKNTR